jgi:hypothetical protein
MIDEKYNRLIHKEIDGTNSRAQSRKLQKYLESNPGAQRFYQDLLQLSVKLSDVQQVDPPQNLKKNILNAIPVNKYSKKADFPGFKLAFESLLFNKKLRYVYVFAAGLIIGGLGIGLLFSSLNHNLGVSNLSGTMMKDITTGSLRTVEQFDISNIDISGHVELSSSEKTILLEIMLQTDRDLEVALNYNGDDFRFLGIKGSERVKSDLNITDKSVRFICSGNNSYLILWNRISSYASPLQIKLYSADSVIAERTLMNAQ